MPFANRAELRTAVLAWLGFTGGEIADSVVNHWIKLCEADLNRRVRIMSRQETEAISIASDVVTAPTGFRQLVDLHFGTSPRQRVLLRDVDQVRAMQVVLASGVPRYVAVKGHSTPDVALLFAPVPNATYAGSITFWKSFDLSNDTDTTAILLRHPDVYLYGTLIHAEGYLGNDPRLPSWQDQYFEQIASINASEQTDRLSDQGAPG